MRKEKAMQHVLLLLIGAMLTASVGGCGGNDEIKAGYIAHYDEMLRVEEIDAGVYMIAASMDGTGAAYGYLSVMKQSVFKKAREHCAQENKAIKLVNREGQGGSYAESSGGGGFLVGGGLVGMSDGGSSSAGTGASFDIVFQCRERTTPAETPAPTPEAP